MSSSPMHDRVDCGSGEIHTNVFTPLNQLHHYIVDWTYLGTDRLGRPPIGSRVFYTLAYTAEDALTQARTMLEAEYSTPGVWKIVAVRPDRYWGGQ